MEWKSDAYQWIRDRMGSRRFCDGEYQLYKILMAARHSNSQLEAISKTSNCHRRRWFDNFQGQKSVVYHLNRSHHFLPDEIQRLSIGPSSKKLNSWHALVSRVFWRFFLIRILKIISSTFHFTSVTSVFRTLKSVFMCIKKVNQIFISIFKADFSDTLVVSFL